MIIVQQMGEFYKRAGEIEKGGLRKDSNSPTKLPPPSDNLKNIMDVYHIYLFW